MLPLGRSAANSSPPCRDNPVRAEARQDASYPASRARMNPLPASGVSPPLSVVMPVRNARPFLDSSIESIVGQTFRAFEFVILDDASDDGSTEKLREWAERDPRIRLFRSDERLGP